MMPQAISKKQALKKITKVPALGKRFKDVQPVNRNQAVEFKPGVGVDQSVSNATITQDSDGDATMGSNQPAAPDQDSVTKNILRHRANKPPRNTEHDYNPFPNGKAPSSVNKDKRLYMQAFNRGNRRRKGFK